VNVAVTAVAVVIVTVQVLVPLQPPPDQPVNVLLADGAAVSVTTVLALKPNTQVTPQLMPVGTEVTVPVPVPAGLTVRLIVLSVKVAVTVVTPLIVVMGHESCAAVTLTVKGAEAPGHIAAVAAAIRPAAEKAKTMEGDPVDNAVKANILAVVEKLKNSEPILAELVHHGLQLIG
jgi:hypothetical protein